MARSDYYSDLDLKNQNRYSDFSNNFTVHPDLKDLVRVVNEDSIKNSIKNLLLTDKGERLFNPNIGSNIRKILFEPISIATEVSLREYILDVVGKYEPRIELHQVLVSPNIDENAYTINMVYSLINTGEVAQVNILLNRIR